MSVAGALRLVAMSMYFSSTVWGKTKSLMSPMASHQLFSSLFDGEADADVDALTDGVWDGTYQRPDLDSGTDGPPRLPLPGTFHGDRLSP